MPKLTHSVPKYRLHRASGQAVVTLHGQVVYLGPWQSRASKVAYDQVVGEWLARGREPPPTQSGLTVVELVARFWRFAKTYYVKHGRPTGELDNYRDAVRLLKQHYGKTLVADFGPLRLKAIRTKLIDSGLSRKVINARVRRIRRVFKWGVAEELVPAVIHHALADVEGLKKGRTLARETESVKPVDDAVVEATLPYLPPVVADMVRFQRLTGCRPSEVCLLRPSEVDRSTEVWAYRPDSHKTEYLDHAKVIFVGPRAQAVLAPYLLRDADSFCFSPKEGESRRKALLRERRKSKVQPSQVNRRKRRPKSGPSDRYDRKSYLTAVHRACDRAFGTELVPFGFDELRKQYENGKLDDRDLIRCGNRDRWKRVRSEICLKETEELVDTKEKADEAWHVKRAVPRWSPSQLRHTAGTQIRSRYGLEAAQVVLGHRRADVTQIYAERDLQKAASIVKAIG